MAHWLPPLLLAIPLALASPNVEEGVRRVRAHLLIDDPESALGEAERLVKAYPKSLEAGCVLIEAQAAVGNQEGALKEWHRRTLEDPNLMGNRQLLEEIGWGVLKKEIGSTQYAVRLAALIGSYLTRDVRAIPILIKMMRDTNAVIRCVAVQMACGFGDAPLKDEIERMMAQEKVWIVRLELIRAAGMLRIQKISPKLQALILSDKTMIEERHAAIEALIHLSDEIDPQAVAKLAKANRAGLRHFACAIATHFEMEEVKDDILALLGDTHPDVRVAALNAVGLFYRHSMEKADVRERLLPLLEETHPQVAITAAWAATLIDPNVGMAAFEKWLQDPISENRRCAAAALATTGENGVALSAKWLGMSQDPYVRANVALGLIGQRQEVKAASNCLYEFLTSEKKMWMWDTRMNPLFHILAPSQVRHIDQIPNYPEAIDQMTRLSLVSTLAMVDDPRAIDALKSFLGVKKWNITGVAAATLLHEGDETSLEVVRQLLDDSDPQVRLQACLVLALYGKDETVLKELQKAYAGAPFEMKLHILEALGAIGSAESFSFLIATLEEPFPLLRVAAAAALIQALNK